MADVFAVVGRNEVDVSDTNRRAPFDLTEAGHIADAALFSQPGWSLYGFDFNRGEVVFVDTGPATGVAQAPFSYLWQCAHAQRLATISLDSFQRLTAGLAPTKPMVQLINTGHCGSTLLHHAFNGAPGVWCISEPLALLDLAFNRERLGRENLTTLLRATFAMLNAFDGANSADRLVVKHFSQSTTIINDLYRADPTAQFVYLYRDAETWANSFFHFVQRVGMPLQITTDIRRFSWWMMTCAAPESDLDGLLDLTDDATTIADMAAVAWARHMTNFRAASAAGVPMWPVRYNELNADHAGVVASVFAHCGIAQTGLENALAAFAHDSHAGTQTSRDVPAQDLGLSDYDRIRRILALTQIATPADTRLEVREGAAI